MPVPIKHVTVLAAHTSMLIKNS